MSLKRGVASVCEGTFFGVNDGFVSSLSLVIVHGGIHFSRHGNVLAEKTDLGRTWIGLVRVAAMTSLTERLTHCS